MKRKIAILSVAALVSVFGAAACGGVQDEVQQQAEDELQNQQTRLEQEATRVIEDARTTVEQGN